MKAWLDPCLQLCCGHQPAHHLCFTDTAPFRRQERPDLANLKSALVVSNAKMKAELAALEGHILGLLSASSGNILEDVELIDTLAQAKVRSSCWPLAAVRPYQGPGSVRNRWQTALQQGSCCVCVWCVVCR